MFNSKKKKNPKTKLTIYKWEKGKSTIKKKINQKGWDPQKMVYQRTEKWNSWYWNGKDW